MMMTTTIASEKKLPKIHSKLYVIHVNDAAKTSCLKWNGLWYFRCEFDTK